MNQPYREVFLELAVHSHEHAEFAVAILGMEPHVVSSLTTFQAQFPPRRLRDLLGA
jgi:hypothetical protein